MSAPDKWPSNVEYHNTIIYQSNDTVRTKRVAKPHDAMFLKNSPFGNPAFGGLGVYASQDIPPKTFLCIYTGVYRFPAMGSENQYIFDLPNGRVIDAKDRGNISRFINDPSGTQISRVANVVALEGTLGRGAQKIQVVEIYTREDSKIVAGDELLMSYGDKYTMPECERVPLLVDLTQSDTEMVVFKRDRIVRKTIQEEIPDRTRHSRCCVVPCNAGQGNKRWKQGPVCGYPYSETLARNFKYYLLVETLSDQDHWRICRTCYASLSHQMRSGRGQRTTPYAPQVKHRKKQKKIN